MIRFSWVALPIAAGIGALLVLNRPESAPKTVAVAPPPPAQTTPAFKPVAARDYLVESRDEGLVTLANGQTARRLRESYVDTITWKNPRTNASLTWTVPREAVRVVPVSYE